MELTFLMRGHTLQTDADSIHYSPATSDSPAINGLFELTGITDEGGNVIPARCGLLFRQELDDL